MVPVLQAVGSKTPTLIQGARHMSLYRMAQRLVPTVSKTERAALESGTIGFDRELYRGTPSLKNLLTRYPLPTLSEEEKNFVDTKVHSLCEMLDDDAVMRQQDLSQKVWAYIRSQGFFGMIIPKAYGGLEFSAGAHSLIDQIIATRSGSAASTVMVPNSLGPGELLLKYGTEKQKEYYLPRLADGSDIPCFGLTGIHSGSDAASMSDTGVVCRKEGVLGISLSFNKRYITLAPVATLVGLAVNLKDPEGLLTVGKTGITVVLLPRETPGLEIGKRHDPMSAAFMNGPVRGKDVFVPMEHVIGGEERTGEGWEMLMQCLSEGRGISLPAASVASAKLACTSVGAYARVRRQFKTAIGDMEGVQVNLARMASETYRLTAGQQLMNAMLNQHEKPAVLSAVMKYETTETAREVVTRAMDVLGGMGICKGKNNFMAHVYQQTPIGITVEGSNPLTYYLIIFGQGLMRSHPHLYSMVTTLSEDMGPQAFRKELRHMVAHGLRNAGASMGQALTRTRGKQDLMAYYTSQLERLSSSFAFCADMGLSLGGQLKHAEMISGRYAQIFTKLYFGYATLWFHAQQKESAALNTVLEHAMDQLLFDMETAFFELFDNFPHWSVAIAMRTVTFPTGRCYGPPKDRLSRAGPADYAPIGFA